MNSVYIIGAKRLPTGKYWGAYKDISPVDFTAFLVKKFLEDLPIDKNRIDGLYLGNVYDAGLGQAPVRQVALGAGLGEHVDTSHFKKVCASGFLAAKHGFNEIREGTQHVVIAGGMESMSRVPYAFPRFTSAVGDIVFEDVQKYYGDAEKPKFVDLMVRDGLQDAYADCLLMGHISEACAKRYSISKYELDAYAFESYRRLGMHREDIQKQLILPGPLGVSLEFDEGWRIPDWKKMSEELRPIFGDLLTAGSSSQYADGASVMLLASIEALDYFRYREIEPMARILAFATDSRDPSEFPIAPVGAIQKVCTHAGIPLHWVDCFEVNEAFATEPILAMRELGISHERMNIWGGAIPKGHPLGASGAILIGNLCYILRKTGKRYGVACACNGGGEAMAILIENCQK